MYYRNDNKKVHSMRAVSFPKTGFVVAGHGFYYIHQGNKLDKERKIIS